MRRAKLNGVQELAYIQAFVYEVGAPFSLMEMGHYRDWVWWFAEPNTMKLDDALNFTKPLEPEFSVRAICFEITAVPNPHANAGSRPSYLGTLSENGQQFVPMAFEETPSIDRMASVVLRRRLDGEPAPINFLGIFDVFYEMWTDEFEMKDSSCVADFLGELDLSGEMPLTTNMLEWEILQALPADGRWDSTRIAEQLGIPDYALSLALAMLKNAGYLTVGGGFALTDKAKAVLPAKPATKPEQQSNRHGVSE